MADEEGLDLADSKIEEKLFAVRYRALHDPFLRLDAARRTFRLAESSLRLQVKAATHHARHRGLLPRSEGPAGPAKTARLEPLSLFDQMEMSDDRSTNQKFRLTAFADCLRQQAWDLWEYERGWPTAAEIIRAFRDKSAVTIEKYTNPCDRELSAEAYDTYTLTSQELFN